MTRAIEFESVISSDGQIVLPAEVTDQIRPGDLVRIVVMWEQADLDTEWRAMTRQRFEAAYSPEDEIYEQLLDAPNR
jgi:bifunctional DNA-binding transcriptional regulator/antitoxin component of YhaV-PrlF toxin-antitoxin module